MQQQIINPVERTAPKTTVAAFATPVEAAEYLHLSRAMVHKMIGEGKMPASRYGRAVRIPWTWLRTQAGE